MLKNNYTFGKCNIWLRHLRYNEVNLFTIQIRTIWGLLLGSVENLHNIKAYLGIIQGVILNIFHAVSSFVLFRVALFKGSLYFKKKFPLKVYFPDFTIIPVRKICNLYPMKHHE